MASNRIEISMPHLGSIFSFSKKSFFPANCPLMGCLNLDEGYKIFIIGFIATSVTLPLFNEKDAFVKSALFFNIGKKRDLIFSGVTFFQSASIKTIISPLAADIPVLNASPFPRFEWCLITLT